MRGFPAGVTLFDGASHGFTAQDVDLSTVDHVEFYKGPSAMLFGKALGGYGGAAELHPQGADAGDFRPRRRHQGQLRRHKVHRRRQHAAQ